MVTRDDLYNENEYHDIKEDVRLECIQQGGPVESLIIPRTIDGYPIAAEGYIFVEFSNVISSQKAYLALNGRKFADKVVVVQYVRL
jgi:RNA recognition motif-containing protein